MITLFIILGVSIVLFAFEIFPIDKTAMLMLGAMVLTNLVSPEEAIHGFANPALITIMCLMILAHALEKNGVITSLVRKLSDLRHLPMIILVPAFMLLTGSISAFISTTAVVIVFTKLINKLSDRFGLSQSKLLMPISFAGILGGSCTLMGTSTNLIVSSIAVDHGVAPMAFFEFTLPGIIVLFSAVVVIGLLSTTILPEDKKQKVPQAYQLDDFITRVRILDHSDEVGKPLSASDLFDRGEIEILQIYHDDYMLNYPDENVVVHKDDILLIRSGLEVIQEIAENPNYELLTPKETQEQLRKEAACYAEILILPNSNLIGKSLKSLANVPLAGAVPLAIRKRKKWLNALTPDRIGSYAQGHDSPTLINVGDSVLVETLESTKSDLESINNIMVINEFTLSGKYSRWKRTMSFLILMLTVGLAALGVMTILKSVLVGVFFLLLFRCIELSEAYRSINWQVIFLLAGMIPIGAAMQNSGADQFLIEWLYNQLRGFSPLLVLTSIFLITQLASGFISNNAVAIVMTPVALGLGSALSFPPHALLIAVAFAANFSFFTPVGYQTNALIYSLGIYRFRDFLLVGGILSVLSAALAIFLIHHFFL